MKKQTLCVALAAVALPMGVFAAGGALKTDGSSQNTPSVVSEDEAKVETSNLEIKGMT
ncbi:MAG: hypothetical protein ACPG32_03090 [Akkermansiaceae bacterium]